MPSMVNFNVCNAAAAYQKIFPFRFFNVVQSKVLDDVSFLRVIFIIVSHSFSACIVSNSGFHQSSNIWRQSYRRVIAENEEKFPNNL